MATLVLGAKKKLKGLAERRKSSTVQEIPRNVRIHSVDVKADEGRRPSITFASLAETKRKMSLAAKKDSLTSNNSIDMFQKAILAHTTPAKALKDVNGLQEADKVKKRMKNLTQTFLTAKVRIKISFHCNDLLLRART